MRVLFVVHEFFPTSISGVGIYSYNLAKTLQEKGHQVSVLNGNSSGGKISGLEDMNLDGISVKVIKRNGQQRSIQRFLSSFMSRESERIFLDCLEKLKPDLVHIHHWVNLSGRLLSFAHRLSIPVVVTLNDWWFACQRIHLIDSQLRPCRGPGIGVRCRKCADQTGNGFVRNFQAWLRAPLFVWRTFFQKRCLQQADRILVPSKFMIESASRLGVETSLIHYLPYGISSPEKPGNGRTRMGGSSFGYTGAIKWHKGLHIMIKAFNGLPHQAQLHIWGDQEKDPEYHQALAGISDHPGIRFRGPFSPSEIDRVYQSFDVLVVPSLWPETGPLVIQEAWCRGIPVIASALGGMKERVSDGAAGSLFSPGDVNDLRRQMDVQIKGGETAFSSRSYPYELTMHGHGEKIEQLYSELIN